MACRVHIKKSESVRLWCQRGFGYIHRVVCSQRLQVYSPWSLYSHHEEQRTSGSARKRERAAGLGVASNVTLVATTPESVVNVLAATRRFEMSQCIMSLWVGLLNTYSS